MTEPELSNAQAQTLLQAAGVSGHPEVALLKRHNHVFKITSGGEDYFLKTYTKDWYGDDAAKTRYNVSHEAAAYKRLAAHGLAVPRVVAAELSADNELGRPYLLTQALVGQPVTEALLKADAAEQTTILRSLGAYVAAMHSLALPFPGYITADGPNTAPDPDGWQHPIWTLEAFLKATRATWAEDWLEVPEDLVVRMEALLAQQAGPLAAAYAQPRFTHGDCHAHQFFGRWKADGGWEITGVVDIEVASAGECGTDLLKLFLELAGTLSAATRWWVPFFAGYGEVDFELLKLRMLAAAHINYTCLGPDAWPGSRAQIVGRLLDAPDWAALLDSHRHS